jgi:hypothetical protein
MKPYPIFVDGEELDLEDVVAGSLAAGVADDAAHVRDTKIFVETTLRKAWIVPWHDGPIVVPDGASGKVKVLPFTIYMSPVGASSNGGTEDASGGTTDITDLKSAFYPGGEIAVPVPLPTAGNARWDFLYAIISEADTASASRVVRDPVTKARGTQTIFTRHGTAVTLAFEQGTPATATNPYPSGDFPVVPDPIAGSAHAPLAAIRVNFSATPATVTYGSSDIANEPRLSRPNPQEGGVIGSSGSLAGRVSASVGAASLKTDIKTLATTPSTEGGWPLAGANVRPASFIERLGGAHLVFIPIGPFSTVAGLETFPASTWNVLANPIFTPDVSSQPVRDDHPFDWRNRWFLSFISWGKFSKKFAHDVSGSSSTAWVPMSPFKDPSALSIGQSFRANSDFDTETGFTADLYAPVALFRDVTKITRNNDLAILCKRTTGALHLAGRSQDIGEINANVGVIILAASGIPFPHAF